MEACLHFRGAALNASEAGISRATKDEGQLRTTVAKAIILPCGDKRGIDQLESYDFGAERKRLKSPERFSLIRAIASYGVLPSVAFVERRRGQVPLNFDKGGFNVRRFATRASATLNIARIPDIDWPGMVFVSLLLFKMYFSYDKVIRDTFKWCSYLYLQFLLHIFKNVWI